MSETEATKIIDEFFNAFNAHDSKAYLATFHFPHIQINGKGDVILVPTASDILPLDNVIDYLFRTEEWDHSVLDSAELIHASEVKVHLKIEFSRYKKDGSRYASYNAFWIITKKDGKWGVQARSSYAP